MAIDEDISISRKRRKGIPINKFWKFLYFIFIHPFKLFFRYLYLFFLKIIIRGHDKRTKKIQAYIQLAKQRHDALKDFSEMKETAKSMREYRRNQGKIEDLTNKLGTTRNVLVRMIIDSQKVFDLKTEAGEPITEAYLYSLDLDQLIEKTNNIYIKIKRLDS